MTPERWSRMLPGVVPCHGRSEIDGAFLADPNFYRLAQDFGPTPLPSGQGTLYHYPATLGSYQTRAFRIRGFKTVQIAGSFSLVGFFDHLETGYEYTAAEIVDVTLTLDPVPAPQSLGVWLATPGTAVPAPSRGYGFDSLHPGQNSVGNVQSRGTALGLSLDWISPLSAEWMEVARHPGVGSAFLPVPGEPGTPVDFDFVLLARWYGNSGAVRDAAGKYRSLFRLDLRAQWFLGPTPAGGLYNATADIDSGDYHTPNPADLSTIFVRDEGNPFDPPLNGTASLDGETEVEFDGGSPEIRLSGFDDATMHAECSLTTVEFRAPFFWQP